LKVDAIDSPSEAFHRITHSNDYDGGEMSLSFYTTLLSKYGAEMELVGIPVFPSRMFRHGNIGINTRSGIKSPKDLAGKVLGLPEYGLTMGVWVRGVLAHEYGVKPETIKWRAGREPVALDPAALLYPKGVDIQRGADSAKMVQMLSEGKLDAIIGPLPDTLPPNVARLFPNYPEVEREYFRKTAIFPIMHIMVVKRAVYEKNPWIAQPLYEAFSKAKDDAIERMWKSSALAVSLPWLIPAVEEQTKIMNGDLWPYGVERSAPRSKPIFRMRTSRGCSGASCPSRSCSSKSSSRADESAGAGATVTPA
jgi:4,5-dihydroxyphthalate decarboxylase